MMHNNTISVGPQKRYVAPLLLAGELHVRHIY